MRATSSARRRPGTSGATALAVPVGPGKVLTAGEEGVKVVKIVEAAGDADKYADRHFQDG